LLLSFGFPQPDDSLYRLTRADYSDGRSFAYTYDSVGNRLTQEVCVSMGNCVTTSYVYDIANRLISVNGTAYTWDNNGNLLNDGTNEYAYDAANRLISVNNTQTSTLSTFTYNGLGDRASQTVNGVTTNYTLDLNAGLTQVLSDGTNAYLYGNGRIGELQPGGFVYHLDDALGSVRQLTDATGAVTLAKAYEPYGSVLTSAASAGVSTAYSFTGEWGDASGLLANCQDIADNKRGEITAKT
jgi:YD repeat-containing protein